MLVIYFPAKSFSQDLFDSKHSLEYASYLQASKQYSLAAEEYERLAFFFPNNDTIIAKLFYSKRKSGNAKDVLIYSQQRLGNIDSLQEIVFKEYIKSLILVHPENTISSIERNVSVGAQQKLVLKAFSNVALYNWKTALSQMNEIENQSLMITKSKEVLNEAIKQKYKKPILAAGLSTVVPGLGKMYCGNIKDGIIALVFVGINSFQSYRYFEKKGIKSVGGWIFGSLGTGFYLGNIYGSYKAAIIKNKKTNDAYKSKIEEISDMD